MALKDWRKKSSTSKGEFYWYRVNPHNELGVFPNSKKTVWYVVAENDDSNFADGVYSKEKALHVAKKYMESH